MKMREDIERSPYRPLVVASVAACSSDWSERWKWILIAVPTVKSLLFIGFGWVVVRFVGGFWRCCWRFEEAYNFWFWYELELVRKIVGSFFLFTFTQFSFLSIYHSDFWLLLTVLDSLWVILKHKNDKKEKANVKRGFRMKPIIEWSVGM